jgi:hypothetical protein
MGDRRCCGECEIAKDSLAGDPLSDTWTLKAGSWNDTAVVDGYTETTGIVELWHVTPHPDDTNGYPSDVRLRIRGAADSKVRLILSASGTVAGGDALIVELEPGTDCGTLRLYQRTDGVEDLLGTLRVYGAVVDEWHDLRACYDPETEILRGLILPHDQTVWCQVVAEVDAHTAGSYAGFASETTDQSDFDSFVYRRLWYDITGQQQTERITCSSCEQCHIGASHFPDVDSECEWNVLSGTWGTEVPDQGFTISAPVKALYANPIFDDYVDAFMIVLLYSQDYNPLLGEPWVYGLLFGCDATADNGWMARIYSAGGPGGPWYLALVQIVGGVKTVIGTDTVTGWLGDITACIFEGYVSVSCGGAFYKVAGAAAGPYWGFEAETMGGSAGDWIISSVTASRVVRTDDLWCPGCQAPCNTCVDNFPGAFVVTIEGLNVLDLTLEWWAPGPLFTFYNGFTNYQISDGSYYVNSISNCLATETYENIAMSTEDDCFVFKLSNAGGPPYAWTCTLRPDLDAKYCAPTCTDTNYHLILTVCLSPNAIRWAGYIDAAPSGYFWVYAELCYWFDADCGGGPTRTPSKIWFLFRMLHDETEDCETMSGTMEFKAAWFELNAGDKTYAGNLCSIVPAQNGTILEAVQDYVAGLGANMTVQVAAV